MHLTSREPGPMPGPPTESATTSHSREHLSHALYFLGRSMRRPKMVCSVWPSSRHLGRAMIEGLDLGADDVVVEYGPGVGSFTAELHRWAKRGADYVGIELDERMLGYVARRFPDLRFVHGNAAEVESVVASAGLAPPSTIISGLPLAAMTASLQHDIVSATSRVLKPGGIFRTFAYVHFYPSQGGARLRSLMREHFDDFTITRTVFRNVPPAFVLSGRARG